jgi:hypothetical protein
MRSVICTFLSDLWQSTCSRDGYAVTLLNVQVGGICPFMAGGIFWTETFRAASYLQYETLNAHDSEFKTGVSSAVSYNGNNHSFRFCNDIFSVS